MSLADQAPIRKAGLLTSTPDNIDLFQQAKNSVAAGGETNCQRADRNIDSGDGCGAILGKVMTASNAIAAHIAHTNTPMPNRDLPSNIAM